MRWRFRRWPLGQKKAAAPSRPLSATCENHGRFARSVGGSPLDIERLWRPSLSARLHAPLRGEGRRLRVEGLSERPDPHQAGRLLRTPATEQKQAVAFPAAPSSKQESGSRSASGGGCQRETAQQCIGRFIGQPRPAPACSAKVEQRLRDRRLAAARRRTASAGEAGDPMRRWCRA